MTYPWKRAVPLSAKILGIIREEDADAFESLVAIISATAVVQDLARKQLGPPSEGEAEAYEAAVRRVLDAIVKAHGRPNAG